MMRSIVKIAIVMSAVLIMASCVFAESRVSGHGDFIYTSGTDLMLHGKSFRYVGANCYYLMVYSATPDLRKNVDEVFSAARDMGLKVMRTWAFNDGKRQWNALQTDPGVYKESTFVGLDNVIAKAKENNMRLILTLGNNWHHYGGIRQYVDWSPTAVKKEDAEFYTDPTARQYFKDNIKNILNRENTKTGIKYKDDPTIMAWELINEPRIEEDFSGEILNNWIKEMSAYIKSIDRNHLVMIGCEGFYSDPSKDDWKMNGSKGNDFVKNHAIPTVDVATFHLWPCSAEYCLTLDEAKIWLKTHIDDAKKLNKPLILGEYGDYRGYNGDTITRDKLYALVLDIAEKEKMAGTNFWFLLHKGYKKYDDGLGVYSPDDKSTIEIIKKVADKVNKQTG